MATLPLIATMIGDPAGIGPEVAVKAIASGELDRLCIPVLIGDLGVVKRAAHVSGVTRALQRIDSVDDPGTQTHVIRVLDPGGFDVSSCAFGQPSFTSPTSAPFSHFSNDAKIDRQAALARTRLQRCAAERQAR